MTHRTLPSVPTALVPRLRAGGGRWGWVRRALLAVGLAAGCADDGSVEADDATEDDATEGDTTFGDYECGNGIVEPGEACDESGPTATCDADCTPVVCGDGLVNEAAGEVCDDNGVFDACDLDCTPALCGDGAVNPLAGEQCDDGGSSATCDLDCTPAECGDRVINPMAGEACDDGGWTDACNLDCSLVACGDGVVNIAAGEACDDAGESEACNANCSLAACGDGILNATAGETCDDAGPTAACDVDCTPVACGDGVLNPATGEQCDDGGQSAACDVDCTPALCGDGVVNVAAGEACDDAGRTGACDVDCTLVGCGDGVLNPTAGEQCDDAGESATCNVDCTPAACGDGIPNAAAGEACDDAGESAACNADCTIAECGDGLVNAMAGEACDDAGESASCDVDCTVPTCGDGVSNAAAGEQCDGLDFGGLGCGDLVAFGGALGCAAGCTIETAGCTLPLLQLSLSPVKRFDFGWAAVPGADYYQVLESTAPGEPFVQLGGDVVGEAVSFEVPLHQRWQASYVLRACNAGGCTDSEPVGVMGSLAEAVGYVKASNTGVNDLFGVAVALSADGNTLAVGTPSEDSSATGIGGDQANDAAANSGAVYVFVRDGLGAWSQQAYVKASNAQAGDGFGGSVALSADGSTLAVGATEEDSFASEADNLIPNAGAAYVFVRDGVGAWSQQAYVKASNPDAYDYFGGSVALSDDGDTLAVGATYEDSSATGIGGDQASNAFLDSGAAYVFVRDGGGAWSQQAYVKASNTYGHDMEKGWGDFFGSSVALSGDGDTLAVGAWGEDSSATGIGGNQADDSAADSGAVYVFVRSGGGIWSQQAYVKASNPDAYDYFGGSVALSDDGDTLAVGATYEDSSATGIGGNQASNASGASGAVYAFVRNGTGFWIQQAYIKASNTGSVDYFGGSVALSGDGNILAVGAWGEDSSATGLGGDQMSNASIDAGAVYTFVLSGVWSQQAYVKAPNTGADDGFGGVALSGDGSTLSVAATGEDSSATGLGGDSLDDSTANAGAVYLY